MRGYLGPLGGLAFFLLAVGYGKDQEDIQKAQFEAAFQGIFNIRAIYQLTGCSVNIRLVTHY